ncbi:hypothetical protein FPV67DRAFT_1458230 [Lyophyllum atratum]|nr:hypothetical protein FPV67DRAFT_1458230 [Lyophyllum atratum]
MPPQQESYALEKSEESAQEVAVSTGGADGPAGAEPKSRGDPPVRLTAPTESPLHGQHLALGGAGGGRVPSRPAADAEAALPFLRFALGGAVGVLGPGPAASASAPRTSIVAASTSTANWRSPAVAEFMRRLEEKEDVDCDCLSAFGRNEDREIRHYDENCPTRLF